MNIRPIADNQIRISTDFGDFDIYALVGGGLEIHPTTPTMRAEVLTFNKGTEEVDEVVHCVLKRYAIRGGR